MSNLSNYTTPWAKDHANDCDDCLDYLAAEAWERQQLNANYEGSTGIAWLGPAPFPFIFWDGLDDSSNRAYFYED